MRTHSLRTRRLRLTAVLLVEGKTGGRRVRVIFSASALATWMNHHPARDEPESPLWTSFDRVGSKHRLEYGAVRRILESAAKRCGVKKRVNPHSFRHARASNLANVLTEAQMKEYLGWGRRFQNGCDLCTFVRAELGQCITQNQRHENRRRGQQRRKTAESSTVREMPLR